MLENVMPLKLRQRHNVRPLPIIALVGLLLLPLLFAGNAWASHQIEITQMESRDPVPRGETVTYTITVRNTQDPRCLNVYTGQPIEGEPGTRSCDEQVGIDTLVTRALGEKDTTVPNEYVSMTASQGECAIDPPRPNYNYTGGACDLGTVNAGESAQVVAVVRANESMNHYVNRVVEPTWVLYPPRLSGSPKLKLSGLPDRCADDDFTVNVKAPRGTSRIVAGLKGPRGEWPGSSFWEEQEPGTWAETEVDRRTLDKAEGNVLKVKVPASKFKDLSHWDLSFKATSKGAPNLKREVTFQAC